MWYQCYQCFFCCLFVFSFAMSWTVIVLHGWKFCTVKLCFFKVLGNKPFNLSFGVASDGWRKACNHGHIWLSMVQERIGEKKTKPFSSRLPILISTRSAVIKDMRLTDSFLVPAGWRAYVEKQREMTNFAQKTQFNWHGRAAIILSLQAASHNSMEDNSIQIFAPCRDMPCSDQSITW